MKKVLIGLGLALFSQQLLAVTTIAGVDFLNIANSLDASVGSYDTNFNPGGGATNQESVVDGSAATWVFSNDTTATLDLSFGVGSVFNVSDVDLSILFVGDGGHAGSIQLLGGDQSGSINQLFNIGPGVGYTGFNSSGIDARDPTAGTKTLGIYATTLHLADAFTGTFSGVRLSIGGASAVPSMVGTIQPVPVPAAVWLFGSGLLGLVGVMRRRSA